MSKTKTPKTTPAAKPAAAKLTKAPAAPKAPKAKPQRPAGAPAHYTANGNKKHQCNGPIAWTAVFLGAARKELGATAREGDGVRMALMIGVAELAKRHGINLAAPAAADQPTLPAVAK